MRVDLDDRKIDFELADGEVRKVKHPGSAAGKKKAGAKKAGAKKAGPKKEQSDKPNRKRKRRT